MASSAGKGYSNHDIPLLLASAEALCSPNIWSSDVKASWLLEGNVGSSVWKTQNGGKEFLMGEWHGTKNINFDWPLPNRTSLLDPSNAKCFNTIQKWAFAFRSGWLGSEPGPKQWQGSVRWVMSLTSWLYLREEEFSPQELGFNLLDKEDIYFLIDELSIDGWSTALKIIERVFCSLYALTYGQNPSQELVRDLPYVPSEIVAEITRSLESKGLYIKNNPNDQKIISRIFLGRELGCPALRFNGLKVRKFLRTFEGDNDKKSLLLPGFVSTPHPSVRSMVLSEVEETRLTKAAMWQHVNSCRDFLSGQYINDLGIPSLSISSADMIKAIEKGVGSVRHQRLIQLPQGLAALNEAALWITNFGDDLIRIFSEHLNDRKMIDESYADFGCSYKWKKKNYSFEAQVARERLREQDSRKNYCTVDSLGLIRPAYGTKRHVVRGELSLSQSLFILIGACAYAIGMMKPMRDGELAEIGHDCILLNNKSNGCWIRVSVEKSAKQGVQDEVLRPIPYLTYKAVSLLQKLGDVTARFFDGDGSTPSRLFYFPSFDGFSAPIRKSLRTSIGRCMDYFCDYLALPLDVYGRRHYFRTHELRKLFLLLLTWDDKLSGSECGAWMAAHKNPDHMQAYTDANIDGAEISEWEAEYVEAKILEVEAMEDVISTQSEFVKLYHVMRDELGVKSITSLAEGKFKSYVSNSLKSGRLILTPICLPSVDGGQGIIDFAVIITEGAQNG